MRQAGFIDVLQHGTTPVKTSDYTVGALFSARK
jgi:hypothetical protein